MERERRSGRRQRRTRRSERDGQRASGKPEARQRHARGHPIPLGVAKSKVASSIEVDGATAPTYRGGVHLPGKVEDVGVCVRVCYGLPARPLHVLFSPLLLAKSVIVSRGCLRDMRPFRPRPALGLPGLPRPLNILAAICLAALRPQRPGSTDRRPTPPDWGKSPCRTHPRRTGGFAAPIPAARNRIQDPFLRRFFFLLSLWKISL